MKLEDCPKFDKCSAPLCPLDDGLHKRSHLQGERICQYVTRYAKIPFRDDLKGSIGDEHYKLVAEHYPYIFDYSSHTRRVLKESAKTPPKTTSW